MFGIDLIQQRIEMLERVTLSLKEDMENNHSALKETNELLNQMITEFKSFKRGEEDHVKRMEEQVYGIEKSRDDFEGAITNFDSLRKRIENMVTERLIEVVNKEIASITAKSKKFSDVEEDFSKLAEEVKFLKEELAKFNRISQGIKEVDFTLKKHANELELADKEKLRLMREMDNLQTIMARMKRNKF